MSDVPATAQAAQPPVPHATAAALFEAFPDLADEIDAAPDDRPVLDFATALLDGETPEEAITVCAYAFPARPAVWWAHECLQKLGDRLPQADRQFMALAAAWVAEPDEERRRAALDAAMPLVENDKPVSAGAWVALAAGWSGGSMVGPDLPEVPPAADLPCKAVNAALLTSLALVDLDERGPTLASFVKMARQLAASG